MSANTRNRPGDRDAPSAAGLRDMRRLDCPRCSHAGHFEIAECELGYPARSTLLQALLMRRDEEAPA